MIKERYTGKEAIWDEEMEANEELEVWASCVRQGWCVVYPSK